MDFRFLHLRGENWQSLADTIARDDLGRWRAAGLGPWGIWRGHFGLASTDLYVLLSGPRAQHPAPASGAAEIIADQALVATARPTDSKPCTRPGLYVFRRFAIRCADISEVVTLSAEAWRTFEASGRYAAEPMGLFAPADQGDEYGEMLLVTWYDGFTGWWESRNFVPGARENFQRRHALTRSTIAVATALVPQADRSPADP